jgi:F-type H+-transporting ATPase subunit a
MSIRALLAAALLALTPTLGAQQARTDTASAAVNAEVNQSLTGQPSSAGEQATGHGAPAGEAEANPDIIMPHVTDSRHLEVPCINSHWACAVELPHWKPLHLGPVTLDVSPTKHVVMMLLAAFLCAATLITAAVAHKRHSHAVGRPKGFAAGIEAVVLFVRDEVILKNVGHHGQGFVPLLLTMFFFILFANVLGLIPYGATATGNISVTATLAILAFITIEIAGMRALGKGYWSTIFYWPHDNQPIFMKIVLFLILTPVELLGKFTKPFALAIRLFANMTAGHIVVLALIGLIFLFRSAASGAPFLAASAIMVLELFVAFLQAFIFALLSAVFIGQIREAHH